MSPFWQRKTHYSFFVVKAERYFQYSLQLETDLGCFFYYLLESQYVKNNVYIKQLSEERNLFGSVKIQKDLSNCHTD